MTHKSDHRKNGILVISAYTLHKSTHFYGKMIVQNMEKLKKKMLKQKNTCLHLQFAVCQGNQQRVQLDAII